jgi:RNA polymerase sigma-70 factor (ECF subfamily)
MPADDKTTDEDLMARLVDGQQEALSLLYARHAPTIFQLAVQTLGRAAAEEVVQEVFLAIWRRAETFDSRRGMFRAWALQIARYRVLNALRQRQRTPREIEDPEGQVLAQLPDDRPEPAEAAWRAYRASALEAALGALPPPQRVALGLAFFEELSHEQVASVLNVPLGTAKSRIRAGLHQLRGKLAGVVAALAVAGTLTALGVRYVDDQQVQQREERALILLTASDTQVVRATAAPGVPEETHGTYRSRAGATTAVMTLSNFPLAPRGETYQAWVRHGGTWASLGTAQPDANGSARLIAEGPELTTPPEAVMVTREPIGGSAQPSGTVVVVWPGG